jgi:CubicO group peptidase (beta-lactamase class C family)
VNADSHVSLRLLLGLLVCIGVVATSASAGTEQKRSALPPVARVAREIPPGAKSVIVFVSVGGKEYAATTGTRRPKADQRFRIGSVTKTFTATIVFQLMQEGKLRLDSTLDEHLPGVVARGGEITIRHLLGHRDTSTSSAGSCRRIARSSSWSAGLGSIPSSSTSARRASW